jgi:hypothetical protein
MTDNVDSGIGITGDGNVIGAAATGRGANAINRGSIHVGRWPARTSTPAAQPDESPAAGSAQADGSLPSYRAVLAVDAERSTDLTSAQMAQVSEDIVRVLEAAFVRAGLADDWKERRFQIQAHRGDGYVVGLLPERLPRLLHPFLRELQEELRRRDRRRLSGQGRLRLRASVHVGPLPDAGGWTDGVGKPMADTHRLLDSEEVRQMLRETYREVTFLAVIVSCRVFEDVVQAGFTDLHPDEFREIIAAVPTKRFAEKAYLYLPQHSTDRTAGAHSDPG